MNDRSGSKYHHRISSTDTDVIMSTEPSQPRATDHSDFWRTVMNNTEPGSGSTSGRISGRKPSSRPGRPSPSFPDTSRKSDGEALFVCTEEGCNHKFRHRSSRSRHKKQCHPKSTSSRRDHR